MKQQKCEDCTRQHKKDLEMIRHMERDFSAVFNLSIGSLIDWIVNNGYGKSLLNCRCGKSNRMKLKIEEELKEALIIQKLSEALNK